MLPSQPLRRRCEVGKTLHILSIFLISFLVSVHEAHAASFRMNVGGPSISNIGFFPDNSALLSNPATATVKVNQKLNSSGSWKPVYTQYRYATAGNLEYVVPVPASASASTFHIALLLAETYPRAFKKGFRVFNILVNGKLVKPGMDVFSTAGPNKPYYLPLPGVKPANGKLTVTLARISGKENPMLSGLVINGPSIKSALPDAPTIRSNPPTPASTSAAKPETSIAPVSPGDPKTSPTSGSGDPTCSTGIYAENSKTGHRACCPKKCGKCGGVGCSKFAPGTLCCVSNVFRNAPSCAVAGPPCVPSDLSATRPSPASATVAPPLPTTPATPVSPVAPPAPPPTTSSDPTCSTGIFAENEQSGYRACCPKKCGRCGGAGCGKFSPGTLCCVSSVFNHAPSCKVSGPPCVPVDPSTNTDKPAPASATAAPQAPAQAPQPAPAPAPVDAEPSCAKGILGWNKTTGQAACCVSACGQCGGAGCASAAPPNLCCISNVNAVGKSCSTNGPPCIPTFGKGSSNPAQAPAPASSPKLVPDPAPAPAPAPVPSPNSSASGVPATCPISGGTETTFRMNIGGGTIPSAIVGADNAEYVSSPDKGKVFSVPGTKISTSDGEQDWDAAYSSHRWTTASVLAYSIPVPTGTFSVSLLFAETFLNERKARLFDIFINGVEKRKNFDVFALAGMNRGLLVRFPGISSKAGQISINLIKVVENPMISGLFVEGPGAGMHAFGGGCKFVDATSPVPNLNSGFNHRAHSVPGGPYIATDFDKNGRAYVSFDGTQSHSHFSDPGPPEVSGKIVSYTWKWIEDINGAKVAKTNTDASGKFTAAFPLGTTRVSLEVVDSTGDVAMDSAEVEVKDSTENGAYCYYYNYENSVFSTVPLRQSIDSQPKPKFGVPTGMINFLNVGQFPDFPFRSSSFAVRCVFFIDVGTGGPATYDVRHNGPFKLYHAGALVAQSMSSGTTSTSKKSYTSGLQPFQLLYFRPKNVAPLLSLQQGGSPLSSTALQHDSSVTLPVIISLSKGTSTPSGGQNIQIYGSGFINGVAVKFGSIEAQNLISSDTGTLQVTVPPGTGQVFVTVSTNAGTSNQVPFTYVSETTLNQPVIFKKTTLRNQNGGTYKISFIAAATYGPDGRLYLGSINGQISALGVAKDLKVTTVCKRKVEDSRAVLGVAFSPMTNELRMYFTTSSLYWKDNNKFSFEEGWPNGKVQAIMFNTESSTDSGNRKCAFGITDVVTGLPVSNHDHGVNKLAFSADGHLLISIGGFTNGGVSVPGKKPVPGDAEDDPLGGVASNPLSAAIVSCPANKLTAVKYDQYENPETARVTSGKGCTLYATGLRNSFGMTIHTNGQLYATDNGPNAGFGSFSTNCNGGGSLTAKNIPDRLYAIEKGKFHGHPNLNRKECQHYPPSAVKPLLKNIRSSAAGVVEYRSNTFGGEIKGNLYISKFSGQNEGTVSQVKVAGTNNGGVVSFAQNFLGYSGLDVVEGPRGELIMPRVYKFEVVVAQPIYPEPGVTLLIGVHPKRGPATGRTKVLISGHKFGKAPTATFDGVACSNVKVVDHDSFTCLTPPNSKGQKVAVIVSGETGASPTYGSDYWYW